MESNQVMQEIKNKYPDVEVTENSLLIPVKLLLPVLKELRDQYKYNFLTNETAVDYNEYFEVIYNINALPGGETLMVKTRIDRESPEVPSAFEVWPGAIWQEREIYDLLGITFVDHPDMRRILLDDEFEGHPLRRDFKWVGGRD